MIKLAILGGSSIRKTEFHPRKSMEQQEIDAATRVLKSDILSGFLGAAGNFFNGGKEVLAFEKIWRETYGFQYSISVNSWTSGLQIAIGAIGIEPGDEVICSPYSMSASATVILFYGGIPVFADIDPDRFTLDPKSIEKCISPRTKAILVVHLFGYSADMDEIIRLAKQYHLKVIEDAAQAPGVFYKNKPVGTIGDIGGFSLNFHKHIHTGEGGLIVTNNDDLALRCQFIRNHGENAIEAYNITDIANTIGGNYRFTELQAAIASEQFKKLKSILIHREKMGAYLRTRLKDIEGLSIQKLDENCTHSYYMFTIKFSPEFFGISRNLFLRAVSAELPKPNSWDTTPLTEGYVKPLYLNPVYQRKIAIGRKGFPFNYNNGIEYNYEKGLCPVTEILYEKELLLSPLVREGMALDDIKDFADAIEKVVDNVAALRDSKFNTLSETLIYDAVKAIDENLIND